MARHRGLAVAFVAAVVVAGLGIGVTASAGAVPKRAAAQTDDETQPPDAGVVEEFFVLQAGGGSLVKDGGKLTLTLEKVAPDAVVFTDRPSRLSGAVPVSQVIRGWRKLGLEEDPPNAALSVIDGAGRGKASTFELSDPKLEKKSVTFTATPLQDLSANPEVASAIQEHVAGATGTVPKRFGTSTLFIDPAVEGLIQYCTANITNNSGTVVTGVVGAVLPVAPVTVIPNNTAAQVKTASPFACSIGIGFTTGARTWGITMSAATGSQNKVGATPNVSVSPGNPNSPNWVVGFTLN